MMLTVLLTAVLLVLLGFAGFCCYFILKIRRCFNEIASFFLPVEAGSPSPASTVCESIIERFSRAIAVQIKTSLMGSISAISRQEKAIETDIAIAGLDTTIAGGLLDLVPGLKKRVAKNPAMLQMALHLLTKSGAGDGKKPSPTPGENRFGGD